jgi:hypothetical protein
VRSVIPGEANHSRDALRTREVKPRP